MIETLSIPDPTLLLPDEEDELRKILEDPTLYEKTQTSEVYECQFPFKAEGPDLRFETEFQYELITSVDQFLEVTRDMTDIRIAGDTETDGLDHNVHRIVGFSFSTSPYNGWYVPIRHQEGPNLPEKEIFPLIFEFHARNRWLYYNWSFDGLMFKREGFDLSKIKLTDVRALVYNADTNQNINNLKWAAEWYCGRKVITYEETVGDKSITFDLLRPEEGYRYACEDSANTFAVYDFLIPHLIKLCPTVLALDCRLAKAMADYYLDNPIYFDNQAMKILSKELRVEKDRVEREILEMLGVNMGCPINLNSKEQIEDQFLRMGLDTGMRTDTGRMKLDKTALSRLNHPVAKKLIEFSHLEKQLNSYVEKLSRAEKGQINFKIFNQKTGRIASGGDVDRNPYYFPINYQNLTKPAAQMYRADFEGDDPSDTDLILGWRFTPLSNKEVDEQPEGALIVEGFSQEMNIRKAITVPNKNILDWYFICADYSQEELRLIGGFSDDPVYLKAFAEKNDIYKTVASEMFHIPIHEVTRDMRKKAKIAVLGLNYGGSGFTLHRSSGIPIEECDEIAARYRRSCNVLESWKARKVREMQMEKWMEWTGDMDRRKDDPGVIRKRQEADKANCLVRTAYGRPRWVGRWFGSSEQRFRKFAQDTVPSHIVQGTAGDVIRIVLCELKDKLFEPYKDQIRFVGCVHDEIDLAIRKECLPEFLPKVREIMTLQPPGCAVDLPVDFEIGYSYGYAFPFEETSPGIWSPN